MSALHNHQIKIKRAMARAKIGAHPQSAADMLAAIPAATIGGVTAATLAELLDAMWTACQHSRMLASRAAVEDGAIWVDGQRYEVTA